MSVSSSTFCRCGAEATAGPAALNHRLADFPEVDALARSNGLQMYMMYASTVFWPASVCLLGLVLEWSFDAALHPVCK